jgi:hypothetical protein
MAVAGGFGRRRWTLLALTALALAVAVARPAEALWWLARVTGGTAVIAMAWSGLVTPRSSDRTSRTYRYHMWTGRFGLGLALIHAGVIALGEPDIWRYAGRLATPELMAGAFALVLLVVLTLARDPLSPLMRSGRIARALHRWAAVAALVLTFGHIAANPAMPHAGFVLLAVAAAALVAPSMMALVTWARSAPRNILALAGASLLVMLLAGWAFADLSQRALRLSPIDHAGFHHKDHFVVGCLACHHNFADHSGTENCMSCHKRLSLSASTRIDRVFHRFCIDCHVNDAWHGEKTGPLKSCKGCHGVPAEADKRD